jgi:hypothetical protein
LKERHNELSSAFQELSNTEKNDILTRHLQSRAEKDDVPKKVCNVAVSRVVNTKLEIISKIVRTISGIFLIIC